MRLCNKWWLVKIIFYTSFTGEQSFLDVNCDVQKEDWLMFRVHGLVIVLHIINKKNEMWMMIRNKNSKCHTLCFVLMAL